MKEISGEEILMGILELQKKSDEAPWALKKHDLPKGKWRRVIDPDEEAEAFFVIVTKHYVIGIKTGRVIFMDKATGKYLDPIKGFHNLVSGDVKADESEMVVLEHGTHFHVISLDTFEVKMRVTLPRTFMATDVYCTYSEDDTKLIIPISKYDNKKCGYVYYRCEYETKGYTLVSQTEIKMDEVDWWTDQKRE